MATGRRRLLLIGGIGLLAIIGLAAFGAWWFVFRDDAPPPASIDDAVAAAGSTTDPPSDDTTATTSAGGELDGTWQVDTTIGSFDDFTSSWVGYRIQEELQPIGANEAAGRTPNVDGSLEVDGTTITAAEVEADLTTLVSDDGRRDNQLRGRGLQTDTFPTATFTLTEPVDFEAVPARGETITVDATGELTLHGVTRPVTIALDAERVGQTLAVVGSTEITLADYDIEKPTGFLVLSVADTGTLELQLFFTQP
jgi:polyisoprenoid-binding protein YceI